MDLERQERCRPIPGSGPLRDRVGDGEVDELSGGLLVGEVSFGLDRFPQLPVQGLNRIRRVDHATDFGGKGEKRDHVLPCVQPRLGDHRKPLSPFLIEALELLGSGVGVDRVVDRLEVPGDLLALAARHVLQAVADQMNNTRLHDGLGEDRLDRLREPLQAVDAADQDVLHAALLEIGEDLHPELRALGLLKPHPEHVAVALDGHAQGEVYLDEGNAWAGERLMREPGWVLDAALTHSGDSKVFAAYLHSVSAHEIAELRLGKKTEQLYADAEKLHKQLDRYAYGPPQVRFTDEDVDQARAAGVLIEFERGRPIIVDRPLYRELVKTAIKRTHDELEAKAAAAAKEKTSAGSAKEPADPVTVAKRERDAQLRELTDEAHGANTDLGHALIHNLTTVDPTDITVAKFFVYAVLGADHDRSPYTQTGERIARIAAGGIRLVIDELRTDVTKTRKDGSRGRLRYDYGEHRDPQAAIAWLWKTSTGRRPPVSSTGAHWW